MNFFAAVKGLPLLAACVAGLGASYPSKPADLTTPVQQRIAINGPNGECEYSHLVQAFDPYTDMNCLQLFLWVGTPMRN